jgi:mitogen-activated protein kinase kinase
MDRHNRKSYLAPPAPRALNRDGSRDSVISHLPTLHSVNNNVSLNNQLNNGTPSTGPNSGSSGDTHSTRTTPTPTSTSGDIPLIATQSPPPFSTPTGISARSPTPPLSLEHLSLETQDRGMLSSHGPRSNRLGFSNRDNIPEPASAIEPTSRPVFPPRIHSASALSAGAGYSPRNGLQSATMPRRAAPPPTGPPTGPLPPPPGPPTGPPNGPLPPQPGREDRSAGFGSPRRQR